MLRTPGFLDPSSFSSEEALIEKLQHLNKEAGFTPLGDEFLHSSTDGELTHYGVKGMKWGVRRAELDAPSSRYSSANRKKDEKVHGPRAVKRINRRLNKGMTLKKARRKETTRDTLQAVAAVGAYYAARYMVHAGPVLSQGVASRAQTKRGQAAAAAAMGLPRHATSGPTFTKPKRGVYNISSL